MAKKSGEKLETLKDKFKKAEVDARVRENIPFTHYWHNAFHVDAPFSLISDPNGLCYVDGVYHIFCQWNPVPENQQWHKNKSWMHTSTKDFVNYTMPELSLWPTDIHDKDGCHSGCGFVEDGKVRVFYTCNSRDEDYVRTVAQRFGTLQEDGSVLKEEIQLYGNPEGYTAHFRDPNFFYRNGKRYFAMAAQRMSDPAKSSRPTNGATLIYAEENDGKNKWKLLGEVKTDYYDFGYMWECPNILKYDDYDVMICCPQGVTHKEFEHQNHCLAGYFVGHLSLDSLEMMHGKFQELDRGFDFYSPQIFSDGERYILVGWIGMPDLTDKIESAKDGWLYSLTIPRVLKLHQGHIYSSPVEEIKNLRKNQKDIDAKKVTSLKENLPKASEVELDLTFGEAKNVTLALNYGDEKVTINYDKKTQVMTIDRNGMKLGGKGIRKFTDGKNTDVDLGIRKFKLFADQKLSFDMYIDHTAVEIFLQNGAEVATFLIYPENDIAPVLTVDADGEFDEVHGHIWEMDSIKYE